MHSLTHSYTYTLTLLHPYTLTHATHATYPHAFTHSLIHSHTLIHTHTHSFTHTLTLMHSLPVIDPWQAPSAHSASRCMTLTLVDKISPLSQLSSDQTVTSSGSRVVEWLWEPQLREYVQRHLG